MSDYRRTKGNQRAKTTSLRPAIPRRCSDRTGRAAFRRRWAGAAESQFYVRESSWTLCLLKTPKARESLEFLEPPPSRTWSHTSRHFFSWFACRFQSRLELELEVIAVRHQVAVLHRRHSGARRFVT